MKVFREIFNSMLLAIIVMGAITVILNEINKRGNDGMMCVENYMYMKVEGTVLPYPTAQDQMTCAVYDYMRENEK